MNEKDSRVKKTKETLALAFVDLSSRKAFDKITVEALCAEADIQRSTFYRHYTDKYDFFRALAKDKLIATLEGNQQKYTQLPPDRFYYEVIKDIMEFLDAHPKLVSSIFATDPYQPLSNLLSEQLTLVVLQYIAKEQKNRTLTVHPDQLAQFLSGGILQIIYHWHKNKTKHIDRLAEEINTMLVTFWNAVI